MFNDNEWEDFQVKTLIKLLFGWVGIVFLFYGGLIALGLFLVKWLFF